MKNKTLKTSLLIAFIILIITIIMNIFLLNKGLIYTGYKQIDVSIGKEFEIKDIEDIVKEVIGNEKVIIQKEGTFEDSATIRVKEISDEQLKNLNTKLNEKYNLDNEDKSLEATEIPSVSVKDYIKPYINPLIVAVVLIALYIMIYILASKRTNK